MSIAQALSSAVSGLAATARGTEIVAENVANVMTPGYARREVNLSAQSLGGLSAGVQIDGVSRAVNSALLAEARLSYAARGNSDDIASFFKAMEGTVGVSGEPAALSTALTDLEAALVDASSRPDEHLRLFRVVEAAETLAHRLNSASKAVQDARTQADIDISKQIDNLNSSLDRVARLNKQIAGLSSAGQDVAALYDKRQAAISAVAEIVPLTVVQRDARRVSIFTAAGGVLLDGLTPVQLSFQKTGQFTPDMSVGTRSVSGLVYNGDELMGSGLGLFGGGTLAAAFEIRDTLAPQVQSELDNLAYDLYSRFSDPAIDTTLAHGQPGVFADQGAAAGPLPNIGLAQRINVNSALVGTGRELWRLRSGLGASAPGPVGDNALLTSLAAALNDVTSSGAASTLVGRNSASGFFAQVEARVASRRVSAEADSALQATQAAHFSEKLAADGVDTDIQMQRLLQYEQAYAANARVIQAIDEMMNTILRV